MNIQNIPLTIQVPGDLGIATLEQSLADSGLNGSAFADSLMAELSKLTQAINASTLTPEELATGQTVQKFAGLPGNQLPLVPLAKAPESEINMEETLLALKEVLEHIQAATAMTDKSEALPNAPDLDQVLNEKDDEPYNFTGPLLEVTPQMNPVLNSPELPAMRQMIDAAPVKTETEAPVVLAGNLKLSSAADEAVAEDKAALDTQKELSADVSDKKMSDTNGTENEKTLSRSPIDTAHLHRQFSVDNKTPALLKTDVPAMSKNFADPEWSSELGDRIVWMNNRSLSAAELNLNPQHLGPVRIRIDMNQDQATITFSAQHASVREALEAAIPRLREMMSGQQLNLADVTVSPQSPADQGRSGFGQMMQGGDKEPSNPYNETDSRGEKAEGGLDLPEALNQGRASVSQGLLSIFA